MDLHILEHRVRVLSLARRGLWLYTHPLLKLLLLPQRCRYRPFPHSTLLLLLPGETAAVLGSAAPISSSSDANSSA